MREGGREGEGEGRRGREGEREGGREYEEGTAVGDGQGE